VQAIYGNPSHSYGVSLAIWDHTVLPATQHKRKHPASTPARQAGTRFTDHLRMEGWVSPGPGCKEQLAHGCYLVVERLGIEPALNASVWQVYLCWRLPSANDYTSHRQDAITVECRTCFIGLSTENY